MVYIEIKIKQNRTEHKVRLYKGKPLGEVPKTYKKINVVSHNIGNLYNSSLLTIYQAKDKTFRYEIYRDGCFYPYYGKLEYIKWIK